VRRVVTCDAHMHVFDDDFEVIGESNDEADADLSSDRVLITNDNLSELIVMQAVADDEVLPGRQGLDREPQPHRPPSEKSAGYGVVVDRGHQREAAAPVQRQRALVGGSHFQLDGGVSGVKKRADDQP